jgi:hypothetical protein
MIGYRTAEESDMRFVRHSWVESYRCSHYAGMVHMENYFRVYHEVLTKLLDRDGAKVIVAFNEHQPTQIFGFCCHEEGFTKPLIHYCYVKEDFRQLPKKDESFKEGIATMLLRECGAPPKEPFYYTFKTGIWAKLSRWGAPFSGGIYKPLMARFDKAEAQNHERETKPAKEDRKCA